MTPEQIAQLPANAQKALRYLGDFGATQEATARQLGVEPAYISQLMAGEEFASEVAARRFAKQASYADLDNGYDEIEEELMKKMKVATKMLVRPGDIINALTKVNGLKRRATIAQELATGQQAQVVLNMPVKLVQKFQTNINNQVIAVENKSLTTISPTQLLSKVGVDPNDTHKQITAVDSAEVATAATE